LRIGYNSYNLKDMYVSKVIRIGQSEGVCFPAPLRRMLGIVKGDFLSVQLGADYSLIIQKIKQGPEPYFDPVRGLDPVIKM